MRQALRGFTLYELLMTVVLVAVLVSVGVPGFSAVLARNRQVVEINSLSHAIHLARKESIVHRRVVTLCPSADGRDCLATTDWSAGWIVFRNADRDVPAAVDPGETIILTHAVADRIRISSNRRSYSLRSTLKRATNGTLVVCDARGRVAPRALVVSFTGRPRVAAERRDGRPYSCAD
ncbi:MAG: GspH/FimT family pseudopilin [Proteobacteria bacterium]|nr:GspH/FimT family pseudopilin [Pseudomonadota bacterium]